MLIDFHTHIFPDKIAARAIASLEQNIRNFYGDIPGSAALHDGTLSGLNQSMTENGVDISVIMPIATNTRQSTSINSFAAQINGTHNVFSFGSLHPLEENPEETLIKIKELGLLGIKLHPEYQDFYIDSPESIRILKLAEELGLYVMLHAGVDLGMPPPVHCTPKRLANALQKLSGKKIIAAHMGGFQMWEDVLKYLAGSNIFFDTSFSVTHMSKELSAEIISRHGADKILFGSDSPWQKPSDTLNTLKNLELSQEELEKITFKNACRILNL